MNLIDLRATRSTFCILSVLLLLVSAGCWKKRVFKPWFECIECAAGELATVVGRGSKAVPPLGRTLVQNQYGHGQRRLERKLAADHNRLNAYLVSRETELLRFTEQEFVRLNAQHAVDRRKARAAFALGEIGGDAAREALQAGLRTSPSPSVRHVINRSLAKIDTPALQSIEVHPEQVNGGAPATGTVRLTRSVQQEITPVRLSSSNPAVTAPAAVMIAAGSEMSAFEIATSRVTSDVTATITASFLGVTKSAKLLVRASPEPVEPAAWIGDWLNVDKLTDGRISVKIRVDESRIYVHFWSRCLPADCDAGEWSAPLQAALYGKFNLEMNRGGALRKIDLDLLPNNRMSVRTRATFVDGSGKPPLDHTDTLTPALVH